MTSVDNPFALNARELRGYLDTEEPFFPELESARLCPGVLRQAPQTSVILAQTEAEMTDIETIPLTRYTHYRLYQRTGDRDHYQQAYFGKRRRLGAAAIRL
ncbi:MAG: hypothetical protein QHJ73_06575, partial [Armatimonadota bacterium]|nr:hypothetical protein [Armatimonadota bacterium]